MRSLTRQQRQILAVALLLALLVLLLGGAVLPLGRHYLATADSLDSLEQQLEVYQRLAGQLPEQELHLTELEQRESIAQLLFQESRPALASASLQQRVGQLVAQSGGQVVSTQIMPRERSDAPLPEIALRVQIRGDNQTLVGVLHGLAYNQPLLLTQDLTILANPRLLRASQRLLRGNQAQAAQIQPLELSFTVVGYTRQLTGEVTDE